MFYRIFAAFVALGFLSVLKPVPVFASSETANFIQQRALGPIKLQSGLPEAASRLTTHSELQISFVHNNVFMGGQNASERLVIDGESSQLNLRYQRRLDSCWQINASGAWLSHSNGWFDKPVDDWHKFFDLPDAERDTWPFNQLQYESVNGGERRVLLRDSNGIGDAQLQLQRSLGCSGRSTIVRFGIKLPLGDPEMFNGNGGVDAFVDAQSPWQQSLNFQRVKWAASVGLLGSGKQQEPTKPEPLVGFGTAGLNIRLGSRTHLLTQFDWHTAMFKSKLRELGEPSVQLSIGLRYQMRNKSIVEFNFSEDVVTDTVPDIAVRLAWIVRIDSR